MKILGIETSCDETGVAVVEGSTLSVPVKILSNVVATSEELHKKTGGIVPEVAARRQMEVMIPVLKEGLRNFSSDEIEAIAVTIGPGLIGSLLVGVETAKALAFAWNKPIIPVNHVLAHLYANWIDKSHKLQETSNKKKSKVPEFPAIGLVVSGGHTDIVLMRGHGKLKYLGGTRDDAAGECFDKCARVLLGVPYPGGAAIEKAARKFDKKNTNKEYRLPRPMIDKETLDMSFSGLKTALFRLTKKMGVLSKEQKRMIAYELQEAIVEVLVAKVSLAIERFHPKSLVIGGGVTANKRLREGVKEIGKKYQVKVFIPELEWCLDNAAMIATAALYRPIIKPFYKIQADPTLEITD